MTPEARRTYMREYYAAHRDALAAYRAAWYRASPRGQAAAARKTERVPKVPDPEVLRERRRRWYLGHGDEQRARVAAWQAAHPGYAREASRRRRAERRTTCPAP